jgi:hypothetical protein
MEGKLDSWAVRWSYTLFKNKGYCIYPIHSFIDNIGFDGTGIHCTGDITKKRKNFVLNQKRKIDFPKEIEINNAIMKQFQNVFRKKNMLSRIFQYSKGLYYGFYYRVTCLIE